MSFVVRALMPAPGSTPQEVSCRSEGMSLPLLIVSERRLRCVTSSDALCGRVVWLRHPLDEQGCLLRDLANPEPTLRKRQLTDLAILRERRPEPETPGVWSQARKSVLPPGGPPGTRTQNQRVKSPLLYH